MKNKSIDYFLDVWTFSLFTFIIAGFFDVGNEILNDLVGKSVKFRGCCFKKSKSLPIEVKYRFTVLKTKPCVKQLAVFRCKSSDFGGFACFKEKASV